MTGSYVYWYNWKYYRKGHLFQDRFKSEPIEDDVYFLTVLRYIHQNPINAGIVEKTENYKYSSYIDYVKEKSEIIDFEFALSIMNKDELIIFNNEKNDDVCLDVNSKDFRLNDADAKKIITIVSNCDSVTEFQKLSKEQRDRFVKQLKENGLSIRQISRLTGIGKGIVEKI